MKQLQQCIAPILNSTGQGARNDEEKAKFFVQHLKEILHFSRPPVRAIIPFLQMAIKSSLVKGYQNFQINLN